MGHNGRGIEEASQGRQEPGPQVDGGKRLTLALNRERGGSWAGRSTATPQLPQSRILRPRPLVACRLEGKSAAHGQSSKVLFLLGFLPAFAQAASFAW